VPQKNQKRAEAMLAKKLNYTKHEKIFEILNCIEAIAFVVLLKKMFLSSLFFLIFCLKQFCPMLMQKGSNSNNTIDSA